MYEKKLVSVVIPTLNCSNLLEKCLNSIKNQTYPSIEIIVVDAHSTDDTLDVAKKYNAKIFSYGYKQSQPFEKVFTAPYQRNYGAEKAIGEFVYLVDSDMILSPNVITECVVRIMKENADAVIVPEESFGDGFWAKCKALERSCYIGDDLAEAPRFIKKEIWDEIGGLDAELGGGDDWDLYQRLKDDNKKVIRINELVYHNEGKLKLSKLIKKKYVYGKTVSKYFTKHKNNKSTLTTQFSIFRPAYFRNCKKFIKDPLHTIGFLIMKTCEYGAALIGLIINNLKNEKIESDNK